MTEKQKKRIDLITRDFIRGSGYNTTYMFMRVTKVRKNKGKAVVAYYTHRLYVHPLVTNPIRYTNVKHYYKLTSNKVHTYIFGENIGKETC